MSAAAGAEAGVTGAMESKGLNEKQRIWLDYQKCHRKIIKLALVTYTALLSPSSSGKPVGSESRGLKQEESG